MDSEDAREFEEWANHYDEDIRSKDEFPFRGYDRVLNQLVESAGATPSCRILDLGIGTGNVATHFVDQGCDVWGIDFSANMIALARAKVPAVRLAEANILGVWPDEFCLRFDRVVSAYVFHHFDLAQKTDLLVRLARDHCVEGGRIVVADISFPTTTALAQARDRWKDVWDEEDYWVADEAIPACERVGLEVRYRQVEDFAGVYVFEPRTLADSRKR